MFSSNYERNGRVTWNPYTGSDHHQNLSSRGSPLAHAYHRHRRFCVHLQRWPADITMLKVLGSVKNFSDKKRFQMSSEGCRCGLATNVIWKAVPDRSCICEGPLTELGKCTRHDIVRSGRWTKNAVSSCCRNSSYSIWVGTIMPIVIIVSHSLK